MDKAQMVVMWKTEFGSSKIERVECTRATSASVWFMRPKFVIERKAMGLVEVRVARESADTNYKATWEEAHAYLLEQAEFAVQAKRRQLERANAYHGNVKGLRKP